jgi:hypothetical protein
MFTAGGCLSLMACAGPMSSSPPRPAQPVPLVDGWLDDHVANGYAIACRKLDQTWWDGVPSALARSAARMGGPAAGRSGSVDQTASTHGSPWAPGRWAARC